MKSLIAAGSAALLLMAAPLQASDDKDDHDHHGHHHHNPAAVAAPPVVIDHSQHASQGQPVDHSKHQMPAAEKPGSVKVTFDDSILTNQDRKKLKLKSEVIRDQLVVMDFAYTSCTTVCPVLTTLMKKVQAGLAESGPSGVQLVTITVDPARDTATRLKAYATQHGAQEGWEWLTGPTGRVNEVLKGFGAYAPSFKDHPPLVLVGDPVTGNWTRFVGFTDPQDLLAKVRELHAARATGKPANVQQ